MNKTVYIDFNDLTFEKKNELIQEVQAYVEHQLRLEALGKQSMDFTKELLPWTTICDELYDFETSQDRENFIMEKAQDMISTVFRNIPVSLDLEFR